jgi:diguanylate cyclase (GGDEF)-like protein/PAS domain S-box-containing protein
MTPLAASPDAESFRYFVEESIQGIIIFDDVWGPMFANRAYAALFGYDNPSDILELESIAVLIAVEDRERMRSYRKLRMGGHKAPSRYDFVGIRRDGSRMTLEAIVTRVRWQDAFAIQTTVTDVTAARNVAREDAARQGRLAAQHQALLAIARHDAREVVSDQTFFNAATESVSDTLDCVRVGIWLFDATDSLAQLANRFDARGRAHSSGQQLARSDFPNYFEALESERSVAADNASTHAATREFADRYFEAFDIASVLDAPLRSGSRVMGFISCEHVGPQRRWSQDEEVFVASMADVISQHVERGRRHRSEQLLLDSQARYKNLFQAAPIPLWEEDWSQVRIALNRVSHDTDEVLLEQLTSNPNLRDELISHVKLVDINKAAIALLGATGRHACEHHLLQESATMPEAGFIDRIRLFVTGDRRLATTSMLRRLDGQFVDVRIHLEMPVDRNDDWSRVYVALEDVTEHEAMSRALSWQATHDPLTGLVNRREFEKRLSQAMTTAQETERKHALAYLDLDQFKVVNDTCGHFAGDRLLSGLATHLQRVVRRHDTVARLGGDEFAVLMEDCPLPKAELVAESLRQAVEDFRFAWEEQTFVLGASLGLVAVDASTGDIQRVMSDADAACYAAKDAGRNRIHVYEPGDEEVTQRRGETQWVTRLQRALEDDAFVLMAQPIVAIRGDANLLRRVEVLVRMTTDDGLALPGAFLPAAERFGLSPRVDRWVINKTLDLLELADPATVANTALSINVSGRSLGDESFRTFMLERIRTSGIPASTLCFEVTESAAIANFGAATAFMHEVRELGCQFALDDFGRGLSSFAYLKALPVDVLKIDGLFVRGITTDEVDFAMVRTINEVGHIVGMQTVAEFVEDPAILAKLEEIGVDFAQGLFMGDTVPLSTALGVLDSRSEALQVRHYR